MLRNETKRLVSSAADFEPVADPYIVAVLTELQDGRSSFNMATVKADAVPGKFASRRIELLRKTR